jgi:predicted nucleic-acid-binding protein
VRIRLGPGARLREKSSEIEAAIHRLVDSATVEADGAAIKAGLAALRAGGDFADGVIAFEGGRLGGEFFVSFDRDAIRIVEAGGGAALLASAT